MRIFQKIVFLLTAAWCAHAHGETNDLAKFSGTVVDLEGKPVADAVVECFHFPNRVVVGMPEIESKLFKASDTNGAYEFSVPPGAVIVGVKKTGFGSVWKTWPSAPKGEVEPLRLRPPSTLAGIVVDENDQPVTNAVVSVSAAADKGKGEWTRQPNFLFGKAARDLFSASTSADGHFRILNFPEGAQATLDVSAPGRALRTSGRNGMQLQMQAGQEDIKLVTDPVASLEGKIVRRDTGEPLANVRNSNGSGECRRGHNLCTCLYSKRCGWHLSHSGGSIRVVSHRRRFYQSTHPVVGHGERAGDRGFRRNCREHYD